MPRLLTAGLSLLGLAGFSGTPSQNDAAVSRPQDTAPQKEGSVSIEEYGDGASLNFGSTGGFSDPLTSYNSTYWEKADWANGSPFGCGWNPNNVIFDGSCMVLKLDNTPSHGYAYSGAEYRTRNTYSYGSFSVDMMAVYGNGVNTSFFTYTGTPVWDEIDFEVLCKNTWQIQLGLMMQIRKFLLI